jgi:uncharacterized Zn-binding protein involved in type VI secretion
VPLASRIGVDTAGGLLLPTAQQTFCRIDGALWATLGVSIAGHGSGPHTSANIVLGSAFVRINGQPVVFAGLVATCSHVVTGSGPVTVAL